MLRLPPIKCKYQMNVERKIFYRLEKLWSIDLGNQTSSICHVVDRIHHRILTSPDIQKGSWTALYVSPVCFPCPVCSMVILIVSYRTWKSDSLAKRLSIKVDSELCGGEAEQIQSIQQTGSLGIRHRLKMCYCLIALSSLVTAEPHTNMETACSTVCYFLWPRQLQ